MQQVEEADVVEEIRSYRREDHDQVVQLWNDVFVSEPPWNRPEDVIRRKLAVQGDLFLVCVSGRQVVGTVLAGFDGVRGWVHKLAVHPEFRRRGIASRLMGAAEQRLAAAGCPKLNIQVRASNAVVVEFYRASGYLVEDRISLGKRIG